MSGNGIDFYENFLAFHEVQLRTSGVPEHLFKAVNSKLNNQIFDAGELLLKNYRTTF